MAYCKDRHQHTMKGIIIFVLTLLLSNISSGQNIVLKKEAKFDTLYLTLTQTDTIDVVLNRELFKQFDSLVNDFNKQDKRFKIKIDSTHGTNSILLTMGQIKYVTWQRNLWVTGLDLAMIGANILILPYFPPVIPFYLMPATFCKVTVESTSDILARKTKVFINPNGYFRKKEKQKVKLKKKFDRVFVKLFNEVNRQYEKNNKP